MLGVPTQGLFVIPAGFIQAAGLQLLVGPGQGGVGLRMAAGQADRGLGR